MISVVFSLLVVLLAINCSLSVDSCTGPVAFNSTYFTIRGPCPNDTVLAPVGSTVKYRCDYEDRSDHPLSLPYWHIPGLTGTPFLNNQGNEHDISVSTVTGSGVASADLTVTVKEQYLDSTLTIQCGLCIGLSTCSNDILSDNIISTSTTLVAFGIPRNLNHALVTNGSTVLLNWSPPVVSTDFNETVDFTYKVSLTNTKNSSQLLVYLTNNTSHNVSTMNIPDSYDICGEYSWNVSAAVLNGRSSVAAVSNRAVYFPSVPVIVYESFQPNITECSGRIMKMSIVFKVQSCANAGQLISSVLFMTSEGQLLHNASSSVSTDTNSSIHTISADFSFPPSIDEEIYNGSLLISLENNNGKMRMDFDLLEDNVTISTCENVMTTSTPSSTFSISTSERTPDSTTSTTDSTTTTVAFTSTTVVVQSPTPTIVPVEQKSSMLVHILVPVLLIVLIVCCVVGLIILVAYVMYRKKKNRTLKITSLEYSCIERNKNGGMNGGSVNGKQLNASFKYETVPSACSTPLSANGSTAGFNGFLSNTHNNNNHYQQQPQAQQLQGQLHVTDEQVIPINDDLTYATPSDVKETIVSKRYPPESKGNRPMSCNPSLMFMSKTTAAANSNNTNNITTVPGYVEPMGSNGRVPEALYSTVELCPRDRTPTHQQLENMAGYTPVHEIQKKLKNRRRSSTTPTRNPSVSLPVTPAHGSSSAAPPTFLGLCGIDELDNGCLYDEINKENMVTVQTDPSQPPEYIDVQDIRSRKKKMKQKQNHDQEQHQENGGDEPDMGVLSSSENIQQNPTSPDQQPEYIDVNEIKRRKRGGTNAIATTMIELRELPPPTPTHDLPTPPPTTPPPVPPLPTSPTV